MTKNDRARLAQTLAQTLAEFNDPKLRGAVLVAKDAIADMIYCDQGLEQWSQFEAQWRKEMAL